MTRTSAAVLASILVCVASLGAAPPASAPLLVDDFEKLKEEKGAQLTTPRSHAHRPEPCNGRIIGQGKLVPGKEGQALQLSGDSRVRYTAVPGFNPFGGEVEFWVKFNFDPQAKSKKTKTVLRNQLFASFHAPGRGYFLIYSTLNRFCFLVRNAKRQMLVYHGIPTTWKRDEWHHVRIRWGKRLEMWLDGDMRGVRAWAGLFGPIPVESKKVILFLGTFTKGSVHSEFTMDRFVIGKPLRQNMALRPRMALPLLEGAPKLDGKLDDASGSAPAGPPGSWASARANWPSCSPRSSPPTRPRTSTWPPGFRCRIIALPRRL